MDPLAEQEFAHAVTLCARFAGLAGAGAVVVLALAGPGVLPWPATPNPHRTPAAHARS